MMKTTLPANCLIQFPSKRWGFAGRTDIRLGYLFDGRVIATEAESHEAAGVHQAECMHGTPAKRRRVTQRAYETKEEALREAGLLGLKVTEPTKAG